MLDISLAVTGSSHLLGSREMMQVRRNYRHAESGCETDDFQSGYFAEISVFLRKETEKEFMTSLLAQDDCISSFRARHLLERRCWRRRQSPRLERISSAGMGRDGSRLLMRHDN
jgi:hypothetical protein